MGTLRVKKSAALAVAITVAFVLGACTRSASTPPPSTETADGTPSGLSSQQLTMEAVRSDLLTQTAQAGEGAEPTATEEATSSPATTSATTAAPAATATAGVPSSYTLREGEHPYCIARRFDVNPIALLNANGLDPSSRPNPGFTLTIPQGTEGFPPPRALRSHPTTYTVQSGETIYSIACLFGDVHPSAIASANGLTEPYNVNPGTVLDIP